ncbi:hypothetical protein M9H77_06166 [Catharanthus roseus]|uniref:Uncharacterized protein n=1 Tax=Catharanthus roseus TaxID=4058 RepID=A0ACC0BRE3_CATRO|nr:hypothetical protein M9H77_06166 [Catharanthus roseus]
MDYGLPDTNGRNEHPHGAHQRRFPGRGRGFIHRRPVVTATSQLPLRHSDMETQIHHVEQEAYTSVLRAFKAQSDAITWEKESLITELRKELRVSDEEHRVLLSRVNADDIIQEIREWRKTSRFQSGTLGGGQPGQDHLTPSPTVSTSCKKQKTLQSAGSMSLGAPSPTWQKPIQQSSLARKQSHLPGASRKEKKLKGCIFSEAQFFSEKIVQIPSWFNTYFLFLKYSSAGSTGRHKPPGRGSSGTITANIRPRAGKFDKLIGRKVWTRWPEDNKFYEAVISDYNPIEGRHALAYHINTSNEALEWVNLKEVRMNAYVSALESNLFFYFLSLIIFCSIMANTLKKLLICNKLVNQHSKTARMMKQMVEVFIYHNMSTMIFLIFILPAIRCNRGIAFDRQRQISKEDIRWESQNPGIIPETGSNGAGHESKHVAAAAVAGAGKCVLIKSVSRTDFPSSKTDSRRMSFGDIEILHTETLIKEVKRIFSKSPPDPAEIEMAKKVLKEHEQNLVDAITRLEDASDGESGNN